MAVFLSWQIGGGRNIDHHVLHVAVEVIKESRELRLQPFNEYRKRFGLKPYTSFQEFTGEQLFPGHGPALTELALKNGPIHGAGTVTAITGDVGRQIIPLMGRRWLFVWF